MSGSKWLTIIKWRKRQTDIYVIYVKKRLSVPSFDVYSITNQ